MATGGTITTNGNYTVHTFTSSGTFTPDTDGLSVDMLIVSPGGGGCAGGAGAGGMRRINGITVNAQNYTITCAAYGSGQYYSNTPGTAQDGNNSSALGYTNEGGGGAGDYNCGNGRYGGSGGGVGGCAYGDSGYGNGVAGQGKRGGVLSSSVAYYGYLPSGGGGGKVEVGRSATYYEGGRGGHGDSDSITGSSVYYAGGGGGGCKWSTGSGNNSAGGNGGGGAGKCRYQGTGGAGTHYLGGGGGGCGNGAWGGRGGYGVIIITYLTADDEPPDYVPFFFLNFAVLMVGHVLNSIFVRILQFYKHVRRSPRFAIREWWLDIRRFGLFWKQRYIRAWKKANGQIDPEVIFNNMYRYPKFEQPVPWPYPDFVSTKNPAYCGAF